MADQNAYPHLTQIKDPHISMALRILMDQVAAIQKGTQAAKDHLDMGGKKIQKVADPVADTDAVTLGFLKQNFGPSAIRDALRAGSTHSLRVDNLPGRLSEPQTPFLRDLGDQALPAPAVSMPGTLLRQGGFLWFFSENTNAWVQVT
jgi:hypothetical protein